MKLFAGHLFAGDLFFGENFTGEPTTTPPAPIMPTEEALQQMALKPNYSIDGQSVRWGSHHEAWLKSLDALGKHGALLRRGFEVRSVGRHSDA